MPPYFLSRSLLGSVFKSTGHSKDKSVFHYPREIVLVSNNAVSKKLRSVNGLI